MVRGEQGVRIVRAEEQRAEREASGSRAELSWGEKLAFKAEVGPGDLAYFTPGIPHQERNLSGTETVEFLVVRSDNERIAVPWED